jgi:hypothetical protein
MYRVDMWAIQSLLDGQWVSWGRQRALCTLEREEKRALGAVCFGRDRRLRRERVEVGDMSCFIAQLQHIFARSGRRRTVSLRRLSILAASVPRVLFLEECIGPYTGSGRPQREGESVDWTVAMPNNS